jgi:hypothetical protein
MRKYIDSEIKDVDKEINKTFRPIWKFTYKIVGAEEQRVRLVNRDPDDLLVSWVPGRKTVTEILDEMKVKTLRS